MSDQALEQSPDERMMAWLGNEEGSEDEPEQEETPADESEEGEQEEESEQDTPEPRKLKLKRGDEEVEVDEAEAIALAQQGYDYTKKTQAVAEERRALEERAQAVQAQEQFIQHQSQLQQQFIGEIAKLQAVQDQIAEYESLNWNAISEQDPVQCQKLLIHYQQLSGQRQKMAQELQQRQAYANAVQEQHSAKVLEYGFKQLKQDFPDWNKEKAEQIRSSGKSYGFTERELLSVVDPRMVKVLHDAMLYRHLQQSSPKVQNKVADKPPVVKAGSKDPKAKDTSQVKDLRNTLKKTGKSDYAAKLIERML